MRENAVFLSGLLVNAYEVVEQQVLRLAYAEEDQSKLEKDYSKKIEELKTACKDINLHKSNLQLIKDCIDKNKGLLD